MKIIIALLFFSLASGCAVAKYDGWTINAEYTHNYFKSSKLDVESDNAGVHMVSGPVFDLFGMDNLELRTSVGPEIRDVNDDGQRGVLINPRLMWYFAQDSFLQLEYDGSISLEEDEFNHFFFLQWEYRFGK